MCTGKNITCVRIRLSTLSHHHQDSEHVSSDEGDPCGPVNCVLPRAQHAVGCIRSPVLTVITNLLQFGTMAAKFADPGYSSTAGFPKSFQGSQVSHPSALPLSWSLACCVLVCDWSDKMAPIRPHYHMAYNQVPNYVAQIAGI